MSVAAVQAVIIHLSLMAVTLYIYETSASIANL